MSLLIYATRILIIFVVTTIGVRLVGKKGISEMTSYDLAAIMIMTTVAAEPLVYKVTAKASFGVAVTTLLAVVAGYASLRWRWLDSGPLVLIDNGKINEATLTKARMNIPVLLSELRAKGYANVHDVEFALLETSGKLSVIPKSQARAVQPRDLGIQTQYEGLALPLIIDGEVQKRNLEYAHLSEGWLRSELDRLGFGDPDTISLAEIDTSGKLYIDIYHKGDNTNLII